MKNELNTMHGKLRDLLDEMSALSQPRSNYSLRHFVVGQHDLPARQRQQVLMELQGLMFELANQADEIRLNELDIEEMQEQIKGQGNSREVQRLRIKIGQKERANQSISMLLNGRLRECDTLYALLKEMPPVTSEQLEAEEEAYWAARLSRQYFLGQRDVGGNLTAILQTLTEPGKARPELDAKIPLALQILGLSDEAVKKLEGGK